MNFFNQTSGRQINGQAISDNWERNDIYTTQEEKFKRNSEMRWMCLFIITFQPDKNYHLVSE